MRNKIHKAHDLAASKSLSTRPHPPPPKTRFRSPAIIAPRLRSAHFPRLATDPSYRLHTFSLVRDSSSHCPTAPQLARRIHGTRDHSRSFYRFLIAFVACLRCHSDHYPRRRILHHGLCQRAAPTISGEITYDWFTTAIVISAGFLPIFAPRTAHERHPSRLPALNRAPSPAPRFNPFAPWPCGPRSTIRSVI